LCVEFDASASRLGLRDNLAELCKLTRFMKQPQEARSANGIRGPHPFCEGCGQVKGRVKPWLIWPGTQIALTNASTFRQPLRQAAVVVRGGPIHFGAQPRLKGIINPTGEDRTPRGRFLAGGRDMGDEVRSIPAYAAFRLWVGGHKYNLGVTQAVDQGDHLVDLSIGCHVESRQGDISSQIGNSALTTGYRE
jgi:hypothetical protein